MKTLRQELDEFIHSKNIDGLKFVGVSHWQWIVNRMAEEFLNEGQQGLKNKWMWDEIIEPCNCFKPEDGIVELNKLLSPGESYWFIASDEDSKFWLMEGTGESIIQTLSEMRYFEYFITDKDLNWLICENQHGVMKQKHVSSA